VRLNIRLVFDDIGGIVIKLRGHASEPLIWSSVYSGLPIRNWISIVNVLGVMC